MGCICSYDISVSRAFFCNFIFFDFGDKDKFEDGSMIKV